MLTDYNREWRAKANIDYFSPFITLWLACNSWYMYHYSDLNDNLPEGSYAKDRDYINRLKDDTSGRNHLYTGFTTLLFAEGKAGIAFRTDIELLHYTLERAGLQTERIGACSFQNAIIDYNNKDNPINILKHPRIKQDGNVFADDQPEVMKLDQIYVTSNIQHCFAGIFEIIYQVRNMLVHGKLCPERDEHEVVKYCYRILWALMNQQ